MATEALSISNFRGQRTAYFDDGEIRLTRVNATRSYTVEIKETGQTYTPTAQQVESFKAELDVALGSRVVEAFGDMAEFAGSGFKEFEIDVVDGMMERIFLPVPAAEGRSR